MEDNKNYVKPIEAAGQRNVIRNSFGFFNLLQRTVGLQNSETSLRYVSMQERKIAYRFPVLKWIRICQNSQKQNDLPHYLAIVIGHR